jgi:glycosyltransferase involved in cell wall biosynthesis
MPRSLFDWASLAPGGDGYIADGFDLRFCRDVREKGAKVVALWGVEAAHLAGRDHAEVRITRRRLLVIGEGAEIPDGPTWEVRSWETWPDALESELGDYILLAGRDVHLSPAYIGTLIAWLDRSPRFGAVWGYQRRSDGSMAPGSGNGCLLRLGTLRGSHAGSLAEARAWLSREGWLEAHTDETCCDALAEPEAYAPMPVGRKSPYRVLMLNRHQWGGTFPGFGGDFTQIAGYREGLRALGIAADLRGPDFSDHSGYDLIHLHHTQYDWAWQAGDTCLGGQPVVVSTITHGRPPIHKLEAVVARAKHLICYSRSEAAYYAGMFPHMAEHISVVPMGVNPALFSLNGHVEPEPVVFMAGKINDYKNQLSVLEACKQLNLSVRFAGFNEDAIHDPYTDDFARAVAAYPKAEMLGFLRGEALWDEYRRAHVHVNASRFEPFGQVTLDALALGCNVVHSRESWAAEQFGRVGSLCDPGDVDSIAQAIDTEMKRRRGWSNVRPPSYIEAAVGLKYVYEGALAR